MSQQGCRQAGDCNELSVDLVAAQHGPVSLHYGRALQGSNSSPWSVCLCANIFDVRPFWGGDASCRGTGRVVADGAGLALGVALVLGA